MQSELGKLFCPTWWIHYDANIDLIAAAVSIRIFACEWLSCVGRLMDVANEMN